MNCPRPKTQSCGNPRVREYRAKLASISEGPLADLREINARLDTVKAASSRPPPALQVATPEPDPFPKE